MFFRAVSLIASLRVARIGLNALEEVSMEKNRVLHWVILAVVLVGGLGPDLAQLQGLVSPAWYGQLAHAVGICAAVSAYLMQSPLASAWLPLKLSVKASSTSNLLNGALGGDLQGGTITSSSENITVPIALGTVTSPPDETPSSGVTTDTGAVVATVSSGAAKLGMFLLVGKLFFMQTACTPAQINTLNAIFTAADTACEAEVLASSIIPAGTSTSVVANDIAVACNIELALVPQIQAVVDSFEASQASLGTTPASSVYVPSPLVIRARAAKAAGSTHDSSRESSGFGGGQ
jgi:hypothetical protein